VIRRIQVLLVAIVAIAASSLRAQDCNLARRAFDNPFSDSRGWWMPRYAWHGFYAGAGVAVGEVLHRATKRPRWQTAIAAGVATSLVWHVRGLVRKQYGFSPRDWAFDFFVRSAPLLLWDQRPRTLAATTLIGGYFSLACFASP
jgi:hypothetical protein